MRNTPSELNGTSRPESRRGAASARSETTWALGPSDRRRSSSIRPTARFPALTPEGQKRSAARIRGSFGEGPFHTTEDFTLYDRCITRGVVGSSGAGDLWQRRDHRSVALVWWRSVTRWSTIPGSSASTIGRAVQPAPVAGERARAVGRRHAGDRDDWIHRPDSDLGLRHSESLRLTERISRQDDRTLDYQVTIDDPDYLHEAVDDGAATDAASGLPDVRVRVPRRKSWTAEHPQRGASRRQSARRRPEERRHQAPQRPVQGTAKAKTKHYDSRVVYVAPAPT